MQTSESTVLSMILLWASLTSSITQTTTAMTTCDHMHCPKQFHPMTKTHILDRVAQLVDGVPHAADVARAIVQQGHFALAA